MLQIEALVGELNAGGVRFVVIGGVAVAAHGFVRATKDLDIVPDPDVSNLERLAAVLRAVGAEHDALGDFAPEEFPYDPNDAQQLAAGGNFVLRTRLGRLDVLQWVAGIDDEMAYGALRAEAVETHLDGEPVVICSLDALVKMKRAAGRPQDLADLRALGVDD